MIEYLKKLFKKIFGKKGEVKEITDVLSLLAEYKKIEEDIKYLDSQQETFILTSLERDFPFIKDNIVSVHRRISDGSRSTNLWAPEKFERSYDKTSVKLVKYKDDNVYSSYSTNKIRVEFEFNNKINSTGFKISSLYVYVDGKLVSVSKEKFTNLLFKYVIAYEINTSVKNLQGSKDSFTSMMDILGTEVKRDSKIDAILN